MCWRMFRARRTIAMGWNSTLRNWSGARAHGGLAGSCARTGRAWPMSCSARRRPDLVSTGAMPRARACRAAGGRCCRTGIGGGGANPRRCAQRSCAKGPPRRCRRRCSDWRWARRCLCAKAALPRASWTRSGASEVEFIVPARRRHAGPPACPHSRAARSTASCWP